MNNLSIFWPDFNNITPNWFLAQLAAGNEIARGVVEASISLFQSTGESWQRIFDLVIDPTQPLWLASILIAQFIAGCSLLFFAFNVYRNLDNFSSTAAIVDIMPLPLCLAFLLAGNGQLLSALVLGLRDIFLFFLVTVLRIQIAGVAVNEAIQRIQNTAVANSRARIIFADCLAQTGTALTDCVNDPVKIAQARELLGSMNGLFSGNALSAILNAVSSPGNLAASLVTLVGNAISNTIATPIIQVTQIILLTLQWAFINLVEAALLLTAISAPIFLAFSLFTESAPLFTLWLTNYLGLFFIQLAYVAIVGFNASIISAAEQAGQPIGSIITDIAFLTLISVFAPGLSIAIAAGGGVLLYTQLQSNALTLARATGRTIGSLF